MSRTAYDNRIINCIVECDHIITVCKVVTAVVKRSTGKSCLEITEVGSVESIDLRTAEFYCVVDLRNINDGPVTIHLKIDISRIRIVTVVGIVVTAVPLGVVKTIGDREPVGDLSYVSKNIDLVEHLIVVGNEPVAVLALELESNLDLLSISFFDSIREHIDIGDLIVIEKIFVICHRKDDINGTLPLLGRCLNGFFIDLISDRIRNCSSESSRVVVIDITFREIEKFCPVFSLLIEVLIGSLLHLRQITVCNELCICISCIDYLIGSGILKETTAAGTEDK